MADENVFLLYAMILGIFITFIYDLLRIFRRIISHNRFWISVEDLGFWIFCGAEVFMLMYRESNGTLRWFAVLGALVGMTVYKKTVSGLLVKYCSLILNKLLAILMKAAHFLARPFVFAGKSAGKAAGKAAGSVSGKKRILNQYIKNKLTIWKKMIKMVLSKH